MVQMDVFWPNKDDALIVCHTEHIDDELVPATNEWAQNKLKCVAAHNRHVQQHSLRPTSGGGLCVATKRQQLTVFKSGNYCFGFSSVFVIIINGEDSMQTLAFSAECLRALQLLKKGPAFKKENWQV